MMHSIYDDPDKIVPKNVFDMFECERCHKQYDVQDPSPSRLVYWMMMPADRSTHYICKHCARDIDHWWRNKDVWFDERKQAIEDAKK